MPTHVRWILSHSASSLDAAAALAQGATLVDAQWAEALSPSAEHFRRLAEESGLPLAALFDELVPLSLVIENNRELVQLALRRTAHGQWTPELHSQLAAIVAGVENAIRAAQPKLLDELELRSGPLREQWEARGAGFMTSIGRQTQADLIAERADVALLHPVRGGGGAAHLRYNSARLEAVLTNPLDELPEVVRLGWLLAQLHCDVPLHSESIDGQRLPRVAALAMLPAALAAGEEVELCRNDAATRRLALTAWQAPGGGASEDESATLDTWWNTYQETRPAWSVALVALDKMIESTAVR